MKDKHRIFLVGFMGTGKSVTGKKLAAKLGYKFIDTDDYIVTSQNQSIDNIFKTDGEEAFRTIETYVLKELSGFNHVVVSCGGGIVLRDENKNIIKDCGCAVLLTAKPEIIFERISRNNKRPLLAQKRSPEYISQMLSDRSSHYKQTADIIVDTSNKNIDAIVCEIEDKLKEL